MPKVDSTRIAALKALYQTGDTLTGTNLADFIDAVAEAAEAHEHISTGGDASGTGNAAPIDFSPLLHTLYYPLGRPRVLDLTGTDAALKGFHGGFTDGRYGYFVPNYNGVCFGKVARVQMLPGGQL